jgi:3-deoxy-D-manno-octulosonate 8-phosphate phosphatase (KDO 8-P phosphatase)
MDNFKERLKDIKAFVFDVDGVFSNNVILSTDGDLMRFMNVKDGFAVKTAIQKGFIVAIITGGNSVSVKQRFNLLGVTDIYLSSSDKVDDYKDFYMKYNLKPEEILYMGDDIPDYEPMKMSGLATCPADAVEEIQGISHYISDREGGEGCVRDVIEQVMRAQGKWFIPGDVSVIV